MKAGFDLEDVDDYEFEGIDDPHKVAVACANEHYQIDEPEDMEFQVFVKDDDGIIHKFNMKTEFTEHYYVDSTEYANEL